MGRDDIGRPTSFTTTPVTIIHEFVLPLTEILNSDH